MVCDWHVGRTDHQRAAFYITRSLAHSVVSCKDRPGSWNPVSCLLQVSLHECAMLDDQGAGLLAARDKAVAGALAAIADYSKVRDCPRNSHAETGSFCLAAWDKAVAVVPWLAF
eukprot:1159388-Pelagomonas_calceolata.AAC.3